MDAPGPTSHARSKKAKAKSSSSSSASGCPDTSSPPSRPQLTSLPTLVHDAISSFLPSNDRLRVMETAQWALRTYGACVKELVFHHIRRDDHLPIQSLLKRRPALVQLAIPWCKHKMPRELPEAMAEGSCDKLQTLVLGDLSPYSRGIRACLSPLFDTLGHGACPNITHLSFSFDGSGSQADRDNTMKDLGEVLRSRMDKGCRGLRALEFQLFAISVLSPVLSSGACDKLEELRLGSCELKGPASDALKEWLLRTKAPRLRAFPAYAIPAGVIEALSSPGVAGGLHFLGLARTTPEALVQLSVSIELGAWLELGEISSVAPNGDVSNNLLSKMMDAIRVGAPELRSLPLSDWGMGSEGASLVAQSLRDGACPQLEKLSLSCESIGDEGVMELVKALMEGAPCNMTLQRLNLEYCQIHDRGMKELARAVTQGGALPNLKDLELRGNRFGDQGVVYLAEAMKEGGLSQLKELDLSSVGMTSAGMLALSQALIDHHACPHLVRLDLHQGAYGASDEVKRALVEGLSASRGRGRMKVQM